MQNKLSKFQVFYYIILLGVQVSWLDPVNSPPMVERLAFFAALLLPAWFTTRSVVPIVFGFHCIAIYGFAATYMPTEIFIYAISILLLICVSISRTSIGESGRIIPPKIFLWFVAYMVIVDMIFDGYQNSFTYNGFITLFLCFFAIHPSDKHSVTSFSLMFAISSIILTIYFYFGKALYTENVGGYGSDLEGMAWIDPNYFAMVVGMGMVASIVELSMYDKVELKFKSIYFLSIICSLFVFSTAGSRGAIVSIMGMLLFYMLFSKVKFTYKILGIVAGVVVLYYLYVGNYFELLLYKFTNDDTVTSGRTEIWTTKLDAFFKEGSIINYILGIGYQNATNLGQAKLGNAFMLHNDFIACFVKYGIIGLSLFSYIMIKPFMLIKKNDKNRALILSCIIYLILCCMSLEPFTAGYFQYYIFLLYIYLLAHKSQYSLE